MNKEGLNICLIDDDRIYQFTARKTMESIGLVNNISVFSNGEEAIDFLTQDSLDAEQIPDVIFLDINMPVMDGWEFLEAYNGVYKKLKKQTAIIMVSSSVDESDIRKSREFGTVRRYINKPVGREKFEELLQSFKEDLENGKSNPTSK